MKIMGVREGMAYSRNKLAMRAKLRNLNLKSQFLIFDSLVGSIAAFKVSEITAFIRTDGHD